MRIILTLCICLLLTGCITPQEAFRGAALIKQVGSQKVADKWLKRQERQLCSVNIDALEREYADNPTKYRHYLKFCGHKVGKE